MLPHTVHCWRSTLRVGQRVATICQGGGYGGLLVVPAVRAWFGVFNAYGQPDVWARGVANLVPLIASGAVDPYITGVYTREQAPEAHRLLEGRLSQGKLALVHPN